MTDPNDVLTSREVAALLKVKVVTVDKWRQRGQGPRYIKLGAAAANSPVRYTRAAVLEYLHAQTRGAASGETSA